jgi:hypothetical protein
LSVLLFSSPLTFAAFIVGLINYLPYLLLPTKVI